MRIEVFGVIPSKSNSYKMGRGNFYRDDKVGQYEIDFHLQTGQIPKMTFDKNADLYVSYEFYLKNMSQDADNCEKTINDCLQKFNIISNDKKIIEHHAKKISDKMNPRAIITIKEIENEG